MKKKKEEGNVLVFHVFIHLSVYSSVHPSVRPLCLIVFGGRERERERLARTVELLPDRFNGSFICLLFVPGYTTTVTLQSTHTHTPPFFFSFVFFLLVCVADAVYFPLYYCHLIFPPLPFSFFFFFLIYFFLFIYLFIYFFYSGGLFSLCSPSRLGTCSYTDKPIDKQEQQYKRVQRYNVRFLFHRRRRKRGR